MKKSDTQVAWHTNQECYMMDIFFEIVITLKGNFFFKAANDILDFTMCVGIA